MRAACKSQVWFWTVIALVFLNTLCASIEHADQPDWLDQFLKLAEIVFLSLFVLEVAFKMAALGVRRYFRSSFNVFDFAIVLGSILESVVVALTDEDIGLSVIRSLRLLRIFKVTRHWASLRNLVTSLVNSIRSIVSLLFLLFLFVMIFALLGMQLFGGKFHFDDGQPIAHFDDFGSAMMSVFQV